MDRGSVAAKHDRSGGFEDVSVLVSTMIAVPIRLSRYGKSPEGEHRGHYEPRRKLRRPAAFRFGIDDPGHGDSSDEGGVTVAERDRWHCYATQRGHVRELNTSSAIFFWASRIAAYTLSKDEIRFFRFDRFYAHYRDRSG
jgi:hypothetical protein